MSESGALRTRLDRLEHWAWGVGVSGLLAGVLWGFFLPGSFMPSYLMAFLYWSGVALGCLGLLMLHYLVGGAWGLVTRRILESGARTIPLMTVLFAPLLVELPRLYPWAKPLENGGIDALGHQRAYLNAPFFTLRAAIYLSCWNLLSYFLTRWSTRQDQAEDPALARRLRILSGGGLVVLGVTVHFSSVDWAMSLEAPWGSTIYGMIFLASQCLSALAVATATLVLLSRYPPLSKVVTSDHFNDLGNLLLTFVMFWAYVSFSQYLIIWSGNLPREIPWYIHRTGPGWKWVGLFLIVFQFAVPFALLLSRSNKRNPQILQAIACGILAVNGVDVFWRIAPAFSTHGLVFHGTDLLVPLGVGALWVAVWLGQLKRRPILPLRDPALLQVREGDSS